MSRKAFAGLGALVLAAALVWAGAAKITREDTSMRIALTVVPQEGTSPKDTDDSLRNLENRCLVWCTRANVPLVLSSGKEGRDLLELLGVPRPLRFWDIRISREPATDEWNIAAMSIRAGGCSRVRFLTASDGSWLHSNISANGVYAFGTRNTRDSQDIFRFHLRSRTRDEVAPSHSLDRMPSASSDGSVVLFHSFRGTNPGGDLYLAEKTEQGWNVSQLTHEPAFEYAWPRIAAGGTACIAVERPVGQQTGKVVMWNIESKQLIHKNYLTSDMSHVKFPTLDENGGTACWQAWLDSRWRIVIWDRQNGARAADIPSSEEPATYNVVQPALSPDGLFVSFVEDHQQTGADLIGIYDIQRRIVHYLSGCGGTFMFPSLSNATASTSSG